VHGAEHRIDGLRIRVPAFQGEQTRFQVGEQFLALLEEVALIASIGSTARVNP
jgi:hypothetical protein